MTEICIFYLFRINIFSWLNCFVEWEKWILINLGEFIENFHLISSFFFSSYLMEQTTEKEYVQAYLKVAETLDEDDDFDEFEVDGMFMFTYCSK